MNCIREAENYLRYYRELYQSIKHANYMIAKLSWQTAPKEISAVSMDVTGIRAGKPCNTLNQMYELQMWKKMKDATIEEIDKVESVLSIISQNEGCERYRDILFMYYVEKKSMTYIAEEVQYTERHLWRLKKEIIKKFAVALFGVTALQAV
ncbi:sigma-70 family RNA polymerase sigma factor [Pelosinus propionicus]|uniref:Phage transcriptional activator, RinA family n=1 Tax=Pelosinus propionicus DSM 13327 TaxID=1123291 RepID=A0A1I4N265_9FIRM|nr:hypothetical protein [Pelosinus propionicus]SFM09407.1 hypothetical protein SAMN04490355_104038 [Pelosinus propionicus DSM 13327]